MRNRRPAWFTAARENMSVGNKWPGSTQYVYEIVWTNGRKVLVWYAIECLRWTKNNDDVVDRPYGRWFDVMIVIRLRFVERRDLQPPLVSFDLNGQFYFRCNLVVGML